MGLQSAYRRCRFSQKKIIFSDKAHFDLCGSVNKQNYSIWGTENPHLYIEKRSHTTYVVCGNISHGFKVDTEGQIFEHLFMEIFFI